jgi:hypothetical protein
MHSVSDKQVDFILNDIKARGVDLEDLQDNLLDHICCMVENEMPEGENFYEFYERILPQFFKHELKELQEEVNILLKFKNYYAMKKIIKYSGITASLLILLGAIFKTLHWPGASVMLVSGAILFGFLFLPLMIILKFKDEERLIDKWVLSFGFLVALGVFTGLLARLMHWSFAFDLLRISLTLFVFIHVPLYFFTRVRRPDLRFNTIVNSSLMMATGGMLYALLNLGYSQKMQNQTGAAPIEQSHRKMNKQMASFFVIPFSSNIKEN